MERVFEKYAWVIFIALGLLWLVVGIIAVFNPEDVFETDAQSVTGMPWNELETSSPAAADFTVFVYGQMGILKISWSFFVLVIAMTGYRRGEKWAWYTMWSVPALLISNALFAAIYIGDASEMLAFIPITTITLVGLLLPYRRFFPR